MDRIENATACERLAEVDVLDDTIGEPQTHPMALERADVSDPSQLAHLKSRSVRLPLIAQALRYRGDWI